MSTEDTGDLPARCELAIGMKIMITENISPAVSLANGSRGIVTDIVVDPREPTVALHKDDENLHNHFCPPLYILVQLSTQNSPQRLSSLPDKEVPVAPKLVHFHIGDNPRKRATRRQLPVTGAYTFTGYKAQGRTIEYEYAIVDIGKTTSFALSPFNAYVALSRSRGRSIIRLLRDFDDSLFTQHPSEALREEERLDIAAQETVERFRAAKYGETK